MPRVTKRQTAALRQARAAHGYARQQEAAFYDLVLAALGRVAREFTNLIADGKPVDPAEVAHIKTLWGRQVPALAQAAAGVYQRSGDALARTAGGSITAQMRDAHLRAAANKLADVGDTLWEAASGSLADGVAAGEGYEQLTARLVDTFAQGGKELGESAASRISRTTVQGAVNGGTNDAMNNSDNPPQYKTFVCTADTRTREDHWEADGQTVPADGYFEVGGELLAYAGDPSASDSQIQNCRCTQIYSEAPVEIPLVGRGFRSDEEIADVVEFFEDKGVTRTPGPLTAAADHHTQGMIALVPSDDDAARLAIDGGEDVTELHVTLAFLGEIEGMPAAAADALRSGVDALAASLGPVEGDAFAVSWFNPTGDDPCWVLGIGGEVLEAAYVGAGAVTSAASVDGWECPAQHAPWVAHLTAVYSDDAAMVSELATRVGPVRFDRIRLALAGDNYDVVLGGGTVVADQEAHAVTVTAPSAEFESIGAAIAAGITASIPAIREAATGVVESAEAVAAAAVTPTEIRFTTARIRGVTLCDIPAFTEARIVITGPIGEDGMQPWAGPITLESVATGDGRLYEADSFRWEDDALGHIRWDVEDDGAHMGAVTVGSILSIERRDGGVIWGEGVFDTTAPFGAAAAMLTERGTLGGVSVDMDDIPYDSVVVEDEDAPDDDDLIIVEDDSAAATVAVLDAGLRVRSGQLNVAWPAGTPLATVAQQLTALTAAADLTAATSGADDLPIADEGTDWDPQAAQVRVFEAATADDGTVDVAYVARGHLWIPTDAPADDPQSYLLPFADVIDGALTAVPAGVDWASAEAVALHDGGEMPDDDYETISDRLTDYYDRMASDDEDDEPEMDVELEASAWAEFRRLPALPASAFEPPVLAAEDEYLHVDDVVLADGSGYRRISGWVAQNGVCHDGYTTSCVMVPPGADLAHFNRQPIMLDDGTTVMAGAFTMNAGHDNDGAGVNSMRAQFDDTRTVAGIVTVGLTADGSHWFSGVAAPWLSDWDTQVLAACRPSGHWKRTATGMSLRAVLSVPVPGFPNRVAASAFVERSNSALAASAAMAADEPEAIVAGVRMDTPDAVRVLASAVVDEIEQRAAIRAEVEVLSASLSEERRLVAASLTDATL